MKKLFMTAAVTICTQTTWAQASIIQWDKTFTVNISNGVASSVKQTTDGGYIVAGNGPGYGIVKFDGTGEVQWYNLYVEAFSVQQTTEGGFIVAGGQGNAQIAKLDALGNIQWQKSLGGTGYDLAKSIQQTTDGGYIVAGYTNSTDGDVIGNHGGYDYWVIKLNNNGSIEWQKTLGGTANDLAYSIQQTTDGGYIVAGGAASDDGDVIGHKGTIYYTDYWIVKLNNSGNIEWQKTLGSSCFDNDGVGVWQTTDGGYVVAGSQIRYCSEAFNSDYDGWIVKLSSNGSVEWDRRVWGLNVNNYEDDNKLYSIQQTTDGGYIAVGTSGPKNVRNNYWIVKLSNDINVTGIIETEIGEIEVYPNPATSHIQFSEFANARLYNITGQLVAEKQNVNVLDISHLSSGVYTLTLTTKQGAVQRTKVLKE